MAAWPSTLPQSVEVAGYSQSKKSNVLRSQMGYGPDKSRRLTTASVQPLSFNLTLTKAQKNTLKSFFDTDCSEGAISFTWVDLLDDKSAATCRFTGPIGWKKSGAYWVSSINIEILP